MKLKRLWEIVIVLINWLQDIMLSNSVCKRPYHGFRRHLDW